jgi:hypothetical protein
MGSGRANCPGTATVRERTGALVVTDFIIITFRKD